VLAAFPPARVPIAVATWGASGALAAAIGPTVGALLLVAYLFSLETIQSPDGAAALIGSFLPPTAPMVMIVRIASGGVPWWQSAVSVLLTIGTTLGIVAFAGRIYSGAVLRIGPRVKLAEAWRGAEV